MPWCATCNVELTADDGSVISRQVMMTAINSGFRPPCRTFKRAAELLQKSVQEVEQRWVETAVQIDGDYLLCDECKSRAATILNVLL
jgi:hypothetical protein